MANKTAQLVQLGAFTGRTRDQLLLGDFGLLAVSGAIPPNISARYQITKAGVAAMTLAAPALADEGMLIQVLSTTANAHTITATGLFADGAGHVNTATFAAQIGASITMQAIGGKWYVTDLQGVTMT